MAVLSNRRALDALKASEARSIQQSALNASLAKRAALDEAGADYQPLDGELTALAGISPANGDFIQRVSGNWVNRSAAQAKASLSLDKADVGLGSADNTSDEGKPVSTAQAAAINAKLDGWVSVPASASASGSAGQIAYEDGFLYICVATDTWQRIAVAAW